jgi:hypothetical protein
MLDLLSIVLTVSLLAFGADVSTSTQTSAETPTPTVTEPPPDQGKTRSTIIDVG